MSHIKQFQAYLTIDMKLILREPMVLLFAFILPAIMYYLLGLMFGNMTYGFEATPYYDEYTASFVGIIILNVALFNVGPGLIIYKEMGFFKSLFFTPLKTSIILQATIVRCFLIFVIGLLEIFLLGWLMFDRAPTQYFIQFSLAVLLSSYALFSFGFMIACFVKSAAGAYGASIVLFQVMMMLSGSSIPLNQFPEFVQKICQAIPMTYVVDLLRLSWKGALFSSGAILPVVVLILFGAGSSFIAARKFEWYTK